MAIYEGLIKAGYSVVSFDVETTHTGFGAAPESLANDTMKVFAKQLETANPTAFRAIHDSDLVVVNGEGTVNRFHHGPRALLSMIKFATDLDKRVHLINHSCFPSGGREPAAPEVEAFYTECLKDVERIVVRDTWSSDILTRMGIKHVLGFDCLPLFLEHYPSFPEMPSSIVIGGGSWWDGEMAEAFGAKIGPALAMQATPLVFLGGGFKRPPAEDRVHFEKLKKVIPELEMVVPSSLQEWMGWIESSRLLITGRFHHLVAAAAVCAPVTYSRGNTPKTDAIADMLGAPPCIDPTDEGFSHSLHMALEKPFRTSKGQAKDLRKAALRNLEF